MADVHKLDIDIIEERAKKQAKIKSIKEDRPHNKDLKKLGVYDDPRKGFKCKDRLYFQKQRRKYGFDAREYWELDNSLARWLYTRLMMFKRETIADLDAQCITYNNEEYTLTQAIDTVLQATGEYLKGTPAELWTAVRKVEDMELTSESISDYLKKNYELNKEAYAVIDEDVSKRLTDMQEALRMLAELLPYLWD